MRATSSNFNAVVLLAPMLALVAGCTSSKPTSPTPVLCAVVLTPPDALGSTGGTGSIAVAAATDCAWTVTEDATWITSLTPVSGQGNGTVAFDVSANPATSIRQADITINGIGARVTQSGAACTIALSATSVTIALGGGTGTVAVTAPSGCAWTASGGAPWLAITSGTSGTTSGSVEFSVAPNVGAPRVVTLTIGGQAFTVTQVGSCTTSLSPVTATVDAAGATGLSVSVTTAMTCAWTATTSDTWITITAGASGSGNAAITYDVAANTGASRTGTIVIAGQTHTVTQAGTESQSTGR